MRAAQRAAAGGVAPGRCSAQHGGLPGSRWAHPLPQDPARLSCRSGERGGRGSAAIVTSGRRRSCCAAGFGAAAAVPDPCSGRTKRKRRRWGERSDSTAAGRWPSGCAGAGADPGGGDSAARAGRRKPAAAASHGAPTGGRAHQRAQGSGGSQPHPAGVHTPPAGWPAFGHPVCDGREGDLAVVKPLATHSLRTACAQSAVCAHEAWLACRCAPRHSLGSCGVLSCPLTTT